MPSHSPSFEKHLHDYLTEICELLTKFKTLKQIQDDGLEEIIQELLPFPKLEFQNESPISSLHQIAKLSVFLVDSIEQLI